MGHLGQLGRNGVRVCRIPASASLIELSQGEALALEADTLGIDRVLHFVAKSFRKEDV